MNNSLAGDGMLQNWNDQLPDPLQSRHTALLEIQKEDNPLGVVQCYSFLTDM